MLSAKWWPYCLSLNVLKHLSKGHNRGIPMQSQYKYQSFIQIHIDPVMEFMLSEIFRVVIYSYEIRSSEKKNVFILYLQLYMEICINCNFTNDWYIATFHTGIFSEIFNPTYKTSQQLCTVFLLCNVLLQFSTNWFYSYPPGLLHLYWGNHLWLP